ADFVRQSEELNEVPAHLRSGLPRGTHFMGWIKRELRIQIEIRTFSGLKVEILRQAQERPWGTLIKQMAPCRCRHPGDVAHPGMATIMRWLGSNWVPGEWELRATLSAQSRLYPRNGRV